MRPFPHVSIIKKLVATAPALGVKGVFANQCEAVAQTRRARELAAITAPRAFTGTATWKAFATGFLQGFGAIGLAFGQAAAPIYTRTRQSTAAAAWHMTGHDLRCAMVLLMDAHRLDAEKLGLTNAEQEDLLACFAPETPGADIYRAIRAAAVAQPAAYAAPVSVPC